MEPTEQDKLIATIAGNIFPHLSITETDKRTLFYNSGQLDTQARDAVRAAYAILRQIEYNKQRKSDPKSDPNYRGY